MRIKLILIVRRRTTHPSRCTYNYALISFYFFPHCQVYARFRSSRSYRRHLFDPFVRVLVFVYFPVLFFFPPSIISRDFIIRSLLRARLPLFHLLSIYRLSRAYTVFTPRNHPDEYVFETMFSFR